MSSPVLHVKDLTFSYEREIVLENVHLWLSEGDFLGLIGPNGSGKTTFIRCVLGLLKPDHGQIRLFGEPLSHDNRKRIGYVSQKANSFNTHFPATVFEVVSTGLYGKVGLFRRLSRRHQNQIHEAIASVGLTSFQKRPIGRLSGGQQQRVFIARALVGRPNLLILDEPTVGVDAQSSDRFYDLLEELRKEYQLTILLVTHDIDVMAEKVDRVAFLNKRIIFHGDSDEFCLRRHELLAHTYGRGVPLSESYS